MPSTVCRATRAGRRIPTPSTTPTGSVGIGATAPIWGAIARRYAADTAGVPRSAGRQYSLVGDAELDEGAVWEAVLDPTVTDLGEIVWIVDFNRQSLDRVVPNISATRLQAMFSAAGWQVITLKYGRFQTELFARPGGEHLQRRIDEMSNPEYQRLLRCTPAELRERLPGAGDGAPAIAELLAGLDDADLTRVIRGLGGHDIPTLVDAFERIDDTRPTVIFAYTIKGNGLPSAGHPQNHSNLLKPEQLALVAEQLGEQRRRSVASLPRRLAPRLSRAPRSPRACGAPRSPPPSRPLFPRTSAAR